MKPKCILPVLLVSACDRTTAEEFISELIDNEVSDTGGEVDDQCRVWRLVNKYYSADVLVRSRGDADPHPANDRVEAHVAYFTPAECGAAAGAAPGCVEARFGAARAAVRVAALRAEEEGALGAAAARAHYEPVPLAGAAPDEGLARVRAALHAHVWPGLRRLDRATAALPYRDSDESSSCGEEGEDGEEDEGDEGDVERAEQFALALGALRDAGAAAGGLGRAERRERAEQLLAALCRALGQPLDL